MQLTNNFQAGRLSTHLKFWETLTSDRNILRLINGVSLEFVKTPIQLEWPEPYDYSPAKVQAISNELANMLKKSNRTYLWQCSKILVQHFHKNDHQTLRVILDL